MSWDETMGSEVFPLDNDGYPIGDERDNVGDIVNHIVAKNGGTLTLSGDLVRVNLDHVDSLLGLDFWNLIHSRGGSENKFENFGQRREIETLLRTTKPHRGGYTDY